ncbi:MAG TPA: hypothetical protein PKL11_11140 [Anaerolineaceae bacterium]|jgi:hypothetical protein|nr:hypothetical protein [Anaerolineaceae bacterium]HOG80316.1 hypothetical protein [Anaerolineaceae bacterium]
MARGSPYAWKVVQDPTRVGYDPGLFYGHLFRLSDIQVTDCWPEGTVFRHTQTGDEIEVLGGRSVKKEVRSCAEVLQA